MAQDQEPNNDNIASRTTSIPSQEGKTPNTISEHLQSIARGAITAVNNRDLSPRSPAWSSFSANFFNDPDGPAFITPDSALKTRLWSYKTMSLSDLMEFHSTIGGACPGYTTHIVELATTDLNEKLGHGQVLVSATTTGIPEGVSRPNLSVFNFRREEDGRWMCVSLRTLPGLDVCGSL